MLLAWPDIDTVFLDMDGTLLDLNYDNHFWQQYVPQKFATANGISLAQAKAELMERYGAVKGTMDWYCVDYWSEQLKLDISVLKHEVRHLIAVHPQVTRFLDYVREAGKRVVLVTNAHGKSLRLKMNETGLAKHFDRLICAHDFGVPKENVDFWSRLQVQEPFDAARTLLVDDSLAVLRSAQQYGFQHLLAVYKPDSQQPRLEVTEFPAIEHFAELIPASS